MPTYDYSCGKCNATYELREGFDAPTTHKCQECGKGTAKRLLTAPRIVFKGSGWYVTDSRNKTAAIADSGDKGESKSESSSESASSETKSEAPTESKATESKPKAAPKSEAKPAAKSKSADSVATPAS